MTEPEQARERRAHPRLRASVTFVLVPGACHGGWWFAPLVDRLTAAGHTGVPVTPAGLGDDEEVVP